MSTSNNDAATAYQRVLAHTSVSEDVKERLRTEHGKLNPLLLKRDNDTLKEKIYQIQKAARNQKSPQ